MVIIMKKGEGQWMRLVGIILAVLAIGFGVYIVARSSFVKDIIAGLF